jgi:hypothetical protein
MNLKITRSILLNFIWISFCLLIIFFGNYSPVEFAYPKVEGFFLVVIYVGLPVSVIWTINKLLKLKTNSFTIVASLLSLFILAFVAFGNTMCGTSTEVLFTNKEQPSKMIISRSYGCGAWDSDFPKYTFYKVVPFTSLFNIVTTIDTTGIDKNKWKGKF